MDSCAVPAEPGQPSLLRLGVKEAGGLRPSAEKAHRPQALAGEKGDTGLKEGTVLR